MFTFSSAGTQSLVLKGEQGPTGVQRFGLVDGEEEAETAFHGSWLGSPFRGDRVTQLRMGGHGSWEPGASHVLLLPTPSCSSSSNPFSIRPEGAPGSRPLVLNVDKMQRVTFTLPTKNP